MNALPVQRIVKQVSTFLVRPHLLDYDKTLADFSWEGARQWLDGLPDAGGLNIAYEAVDRHVLRGRGAKTAIRWLGTSGARREISFADLDASVQGWIAHVRHGQTWGLRRSLLSVPLSPVSGFKNGGMNGWGA